MEMTMNLPRDMEDGVYVVDKVVEPSELHVSSVSDVKAVTLSQAATLCQIRMKVDMVKEPAEPQEINGELVSTLGIVGAEERAAKGQEGAGQAQQDLTVHYRSWLRSIAEFRK
jgi:hypothetical protein